MTMTAPTVEVWKSGTGKVLAVGDIVYTDAKVQGSRTTYRYRVQAIRVFPDRVEVDVFGGKADRPRLRTFLADVLHRDRKAEGIR